MLKRSAVLMMIERSLMSCGEENQPWDCQCALFSGLLYAESPSLDARSFVLGT